MSGFIKLGIIGIGNMWSNHAKNIATGKDGINGLILSNAMHLSSFLQKSIDIPFANELFYEELMKRVVTSKKKTNVDEVIADTSNSFKGTK